MKKIFILSDINNPHTIKWVQVLIAHYDIMLFSLNCPTDDWYKQYNNLKVTFCNLATPISEKSNFGKIKYLTAIKKLKNTIYQYKPDIIHAHYASSYGLLAALTQKNKFILSVWGSDIFTFPKTSFIHKRIIQFVLSRSRHILSSSEIMAKETQKYISKPIQVIPFGVNTLKFSSTNNNTSDETFTIGVAKALKDVYGIDMLIRATKIIVNNNPHKKIKLLIAGEGPQRDKLRQIVTSLHLEEQVIFLGKIVNADMPRFYNSVNISVFLSRSESFGVSAIESLACERPVVVSEAPGFVEVVKKGGVIVPINDYHTAANMIQKFIDSPSLLRTMGQQGRNHVRKHYDMLYCAQELCKTYEKYI